jgi:endonuclease/exonuclease/phosphatase family metal-dependent hydrolase
LATDSHACEVLREQLPILEGWIDDRAREGTAFAVLGDFNRRFGTGDEFWADIDDGDPPDAVLTDVSTSHRSECWGGEYPVYIDHLVFGRESARWLVPDSFRQLVFDESDAPFKGRLSDHCPVVVSLALGGSP